MESCGFGTIVYKISNAFQNYLSFQESNCPMLGNWTIALWLLKIISQKTTALCGSCWKMAHVSLPKIKAVGYFAHDESCTARIFRLGYQVFTNINMSPNPKCISISIYISMYIYICIYIICIHMFSHMFSYILRGKLDPFASAQVWCPWSRCRALSGWSEMKQGGTTRNNWICSPEFTG